MNDLFRVRLDFPDNPALDDEFLAQNGATYRWDGVVWVPIGSGRDVYLPLAGGTMDAGSFVTLGANPNVAMHAATKQYVDTIATGARLIIGIIDATNGRCIYSGATGLPPGPLVDASTVQSGSDVICVVAGTIPPDPLLPPEVWNMTLAVSDVLVSNGANWILVHVPRAPITAGQVTTIPSVFGSNNVQDALMQAALQDMPPGGAVGQILTKRVGGDYDTEWTDASDPVNYTNIFMNRTPGGSGAIDPNNFPIGSQSIWMNNAPVNCPPMSAGNTVQGFWQINTYMSGATGLQQAIEHTNPSPGPSTILSMWIRPRGNLQTTWGPWVQQSISNTDGAFVPLTGTADGAPMTGRLQITTAGGAETTDSGQLQLIGQTSRLEVASSTGGDFRFVNRGNDQGGLTYVSGAVPTYVDWLIFNANNSALSINNLNGNGITIINGTLTITGDLSATGGSFAGRVTAALAPTNNAHLCNKGYVDQLFSAAPILIGVIDAGTGNCQFADGTVGPLPIPTGSRHYIICTRAGTVPGLGVTMRLGDELFDGLIAGVPGWILIAVGTGGILTTADQVALIPNVAGTNNVQAGMQVLNTNKVEKAGDTLSGKLSWPSTITSAPPNATGTSAGERVRIYDAAGAPGMGIGVEPNNMWFNNAAAGNGYRFYLGANLTYTMNSTSFQLKQAGAGGISLHNGSASQCGYTEYFTQEGTRRGYTGYKGAGNTLIMKAENGWSWEITEALPYLNLSGALLTTMAPNTEGIRLRKNNTTANTTTPRLKFEASDGRAMGWIFGMQLGGNGYYGTWPSQMRCSVGLGGYGEQTCWTSVAYGGGWVGLRVEGDLSARSYFNNSDASLKSDIVPLDPAVAQKAFESLSPVQFHWKPKKVEDPLAAPHGWRHGPDEDPDSRSWGFLAQDIEKGAPHLVQGSVGSKSYDLAGVIAVLCSKLKSMEDELHHLKAHTFSDDIDTKEHARRVLWPHGRTHKAKH